MRKNSKLHIGISTEDIEVLKKRAKQCRLTLASYCVYVLMNSQPEIKNYDFKTK